jgi:D-alanyl-D-alanine carboxypeptidase
MKLLNFRSSVKSKEFRIQVAILLGLVLVTVTASEFSKSQDAQEQLVSKVALPLWCFDSEADSLWRSVVKEGCGQDKSLGATKISAPVNDASDLDIYVKTRFLAAQSDARKKGINLVITSGFRTAARQEYLFQKAVQKYGSEKEASKWVLPPDKSHHPDGIALDVNYPGNPGDTKWLEVNGYKYGLCRVYKNEWWHFEPVIAPGEKCPPLVANALTKVE